MPSDTERLRNELDRAVVVRRAEPSRHEDCVTIVERRAQRRLELAGVVADDRDSRRLEPEPKRLACEIRPVQIGSLAAHELAARDDDDGLRARQPFKPGLTTIFTFRCAGSVSGFPASRNFAPAGCRTESQNFRPTMNSLSPRRSVPWKTTGPRPELRRISMYVPLPRPTNPIPTGAAVFCGCWTAGGVYVVGSLPPNFHATMTRAVSVAMPASARTTT